MRIEIACNAGACYGVNRALKMAHEAAFGSTPVHTLGPLIHNPRVVAELEAKGIRVAEELDDVGGGIVLIRTHGAAPQVIDEARRRGFEVVDATCPYVTKAQRCARDLALGGYSVVIIGEAGHPEVEGIRAWAGDAVVAIVDDPAELPAELPDKVGVVIQTTQRKSNAARVIDALGDRCREVRVEDTICFATEQRQKAAAELAARVQVMIVIGGRNSGNTRRLYEICADVCPKTYHIEGPEELDPSWFEGVETVGITAGASTPEEHITDVSGAIHDLSR